MGLARDRCMETTTTTGTGDITTAGAVVGYQTISSGIVDLNKFFDYAIEAVDANNIPTGDWEVGEGYLSSSTVLVRAVVGASSNAGALVNLTAGTKRVFVTLAAAEIQDKGQILARANFLAMN